MTNDSTDLGVASAARPARDQDARGEFGEACVISANAAKVLETTRGAWQDAAAKVLKEAPKEAARRPPRASQPKKRVVPRRSRWPSLVAALNYWSPKPL